MHTLFMQNRGGQILIQVLVFLGIAVVFISVLVNLAITTLESVGRGYASEQSFQIAEAGIEYYRWYLAHNPTDFTNGTGEPGPYILPYADKDGNTIGEIILEIDPPPLGSTLVVIRSKGVLYADLAAARTIQVKLGIESFAKFAVVSNDALNFPPGTVSYGPIHSNDGIHFDGIAFNIVSSAKSQYNDPDHSGQDEFGVHTHVSPIDPQPPAEVPDRPDVFVAGREFPVPEVDFDGIAADLADIKIAAEISGLYFPDSDKFGYEAVLRTDDTFDLYRVEKLMQKPGGCSSEVSDEDWGIWSVDTTTFLGNYAFPANGLIFFEDHVWLRGQIETARITVAAAHFPDSPGQRKHIIINSDLTYTHYDGKDVIGLISQDDIVTGLYSEDDLRIDAVLMAKTGHAGRYYYRPPGGPQDFCGDEAVRDTITLFGMIGSYESYGYSWSCGGVFCSGYENKILIYDPNLLFAPPPNFPLTSDELKILSWEEL
jgi:hypothetical protein